HPSHRRRSRPFFGHVGPVVLSLVLLRRSVQHHCLPVGDAVLRLSALGGALLALVVVALLWPMAHLLFAAHMAQHLLLIAAVAPLLVLGGIKIHRPPLLGWTLFVGVFLFWHWPTAFRWAAQHPAAELFELSSILACAWCFWNGVFGKN